MRCLTASASNDVLEPPPARKQTLARHKEAGLAEATTVLESETLPKTMKPNKRGLLLLLSASPGYGTTRSRVRTGRQPRRRALNEADLARVLAVVTEDTGLRSTELSEATVISHRSPLGFPSRPDRKARITHLQRNRLASRRLERGRSHSQKTNRLGSN